ncbi:MAG: hypothetical protein WBG19_00260 [Thermoplasmata archaeon]
MTETAVVTTEKRRPNHTFTPEERLKGSQAAKERRLARQVGASGQTLVQADYSGYTTVKDVRESKTCLDLIETLERLVAVLRETVPSAFKGLPAHLNATRTAIDSAAKLFGWDQKQTTHNHIDFYVGARLKPKTPQ